MATTRSALTDENVLSLVKGATHGERALAARKLCATIDREILSDQDREFAEDILRVIAADAVELVRRAIAETLNSSTVVPRDVALRLARDVELVSLPMLACSSAFTDDDFAEVVRLGGGVRQVAIARRPRLSRVVTDSLVEHGGESAIAAACANPGADFADNALSRVIDRFEASERALAAVAYRSVLPLSITERLITLVSDQVREHLISHQAVSARDALEIATGAAERATVTHLRSQCRLTVSLLLRALAHGHMTFSNGASPSWPVCRAIGPG